jgi:hypothetical protein
MNIVNINRMNMVTALGQKGRSRILHTTAKMWPIAIFAFNIWQKFSIKIYPKALVSKIKVVLERFLK